MRGKVGSEWKFATSDKFAKFRLDRDRGFYLGNSARGDPKYWYCPRGIWAKKIRITLPLYCCLDYERRRYCERVASTLAFWRQTAPERESERNFSNPCCKYAMFYNIFWVPDPPLRRFFVLFANCLVWLSRTPPGAPPATWPDPADDKT